MVDFEVVPFHEEPFVAALEVPGVAGVLVTGGKIERGDGDQGTDGLEEKRMVDGAEMGEE